MNDVLGFLYARPSFIEGVARIFDFGNTLTEYNRSLTPQQADFLALRADWQAAARDLGMTLSEVSEAASSSENAEERPGSRANA